MTLSELAPTESVLSFAQEGRFHAPAGSPAWNIPFALRIEGQLAPILLERCLGEIVRRHQILRSEIRTVGGRSILITCDFALPSLPLVDVEPLLETVRDRDEEVLRLQIAEAGTPFDFPQKPLFRFKLLRLREAEYLLLLTFHHSVFDGRWSLAVLMRELRVLYEAFEQRRSSPLPELSLQYYDHAAWEREKYRGDALERTLARWRTRFADAPRVLALPTDRPRPPIRTFRGGCQTFTLSGPMTRALKSLSRKEGVTLFMTLLTAFKVLLYHASAQTKVVVGTAVATRNRPGTRDLIGNFVNFLPVLTDLSGNPSFGAVLGRVREALLEAYADPELPFEALVAALDPASDRSRPPLCQVFFAWHGPTPAPQRFSGLTVNLLHSGILTQSCKVDMHVHLAEERENEVTVEVEYCADLFGSKTVAWFLNRYQRLLEVAVASPGQLIGSLAGAIDVQGLAALSARDRFPVSANFLKEERPLPPSL